MPEIYCTKCGLRGNSKCPHCRTIFPSYPKGGDDAALKELAQDWFETFMGVGLYATDPDERKTAYERLNNGEEVQFRVSFWTYARSTEEAAQGIISRLMTLLPLINAKVAWCMHDWQIMPGQKSSIGCGHEGDPNAVVPPDPFAQQIA